MKNCQREEKIDYISVCVCIGHIHPIFNVKERGCYAEDGRQADCLSKLLYIYRFPNLC